MGTGGKESLFSSHGQMGKCRVVGGGCVQRLEIC